MASCCSLSAGRNIEDGIADPSTLLLSVSPRSLYLSIYLSIPPLHSFLLSHLIPSFSLLRSCFSPLALCLSLVILHSFIVPSSLILSIPLSVGACQSDSWVDEHWRWAETGHLPVPSSHSSLLLCPSAAAGEQRSRHRRRCITSAHESWILVKGWPVAALMLVAVLA